MIDAEVRRIIDEGYETAKRILIEKADDLKRLAEGLLEYETLTGPEIMKVINGEPLRRGEDKDDKPSGGNATSLPSVPRSPKPKAVGEGGMEPEPLG